MKMIDIYNSINIHSEDEAFRYLLANLKKTMRTYDFFVAWEKVLAKVSSVDVALNIMNSLIGKANIKDELRKLIKQYPEIVPLIPFLIAVREKNIRVLDECLDIEYSFEKRHFYSEGDLDKIILFAEKCGLLKILADRNIKNLVDYSVGIEVGLDTNARKNRSGTTMENLIEVYVKAICYKQNFEYLKQATVAKIKEKFCKDVPTDKSNRRFDFAINTKNKVYVIEVNYYGDSGSKLKAVAGELKELHERISNNNDVKFIWITDGLGWNKTRYSFEDAFKAIDYVLNIKMIEDGILEEIIKKEL